MQGTYHANTVARSRNQRSQENSTSSLCIVDLHVAVKNIEKINKETQQGVLNCTLVELQIFHIFSYLLVYPHRSIPLRYDSDLYRRQQ